MSLIEIKGVPPDTVVMQVGDSCQLRTAVEADLLGAKCTGEKVLTFTLEKIEKGYAHFRLGEEPFSWGGRFSEGAVADLEREADRLVKLSREMMALVEEARKRTRIEETEVRRELEARRTFR